MVQLGANRYGKAEVRLVHVARGAGAGGQDLIRDWNISSSLSGDLAGSHLTGSNEHVYATDSQKNKAYALARELGARRAAGGVRDGARLVLRLLPGADQPGPDRDRRVRLDADRRHRVLLRPLRRPGADHRRCTSTTTAGVSVVSGLKDLTVMNTTASEFWGYPKDGYTTLPETKDRILATSVNASWRFAPAAVAAGLDWDAAFATAKATILATFAGTYSYSLQQMLFAIGGELIEAVPGVCEVRLALPNKHHYIVDLSPFGLENDREVYLAGDRPYGLIEGTVLADDAPGAGLAWA